MVRLTCVSAASASERVSGVAVIVRHRASQRTSVRGIINESKIARRYVLLHVSLRHLADCKLQIEYVYVLYRAQRSVYVRI